MSRFLISTALVVGIACSPKDSANVVHDYTDSVFQPGQVWRYNTRPGEEASTLEVLKVETHPKTGVIVHIAVSGVRVRMPSGVYTHELGHLPLAEDALRRSVTTKVRDGAPTARGTEGYREWRRAFDAGRGGVFTTTVAECVSFVEQAASKARTR